MTITPTSALDEVIAELRQLLDDRVSTGAAVREQHGHGESNPMAFPPDAVCFPTSTEEVAAIVRTCGSHRVPVIAFGAGTSLEAHVAAIHGGVCIDLTGMDRVVEVRVPDLDVTVQAGVTRKQLNDILVRDGLFFPVDPGADATLGGMAATRASGTTTVRYGSMRDNVVNLTVVTADGTVIRTASRARKSAAGYDLTRLFTGSEGTLGIITELTLRVYGIPEATAAAVATFPTVDDAVRAVIEVVQLGVPIARSELLDETQIDAVNRYADLDLVVAPTVCFELHGSERGVAEDAESVGAIAATHGAVDFQWSTDQAERNRLWAARHNAFFAACALRPGTKPITTDVCVPVSRLAECIAETKADLASLGSSVCLLGHIGDGNFHLIFLVDESSAEEVAAVEAANERMVHRALAMDGTCTGEHGVGVGKQHFLEAEHGPALDVMRQIKAALDPQGILNPGKLLPDAAPAP
ncbi:MAG: FAD-binding protein [Actinomycetota bacterium]|nr:FAD-binding protein [Actinomycetota bacterium]